MLLLVMAATGCRAGAGGGEVGVVRNGGPYDNKAIKDCLPPAGRRKWIGFNSSVHKYPAEGVQRFFKITSDPKEGADFQGVVRAKTADGFNVHLSGTFYFETRFACEKGSTGRKLVEDFDKQFGVRKFPDPRTGTNLSPWNGDDGFSAFLNSQMLPIIQNELRVAMLKFSCEEVVSSCALVASRQVLADNSDTPKTVDKQKAKQIGVNLQKVQDEIQTGFAAELNKTFGEQYFKNIKFLMSQPDLDPDIEDAINKSLAAFAVVSQATAQVQQATKQAQAAKQLAQVYRNSPQLAELEKWRIICGTKPGDNTTGGCRDVQIVTGLSNSIIAGSGSRRK